jgi:hypothetical protein
VCLQHIIKTHSDVWWCVSALAQDFSDTPYNTSAEEDSIARFMCQIESVPKAMISWERNWKPLPHNSRYVLYYIMLDPVKFVYINFSFININCD